MEDEFETIRSYERIFRFDRKIHKIEGWVLPRPVPLDVLGWFLIGLMLSLIASYVPPMKYVYGSIAVPFRFVVIPFGLAMLASQLETQGRPVYKFLWSWARNITSTSRKSLGRALSAEGRVRSVDFGVWMTRDRFSHVLHSANVVGPARVRFSCRVWAHMNRKGTEVVVITEAPRTVVFAGRLGTAWTRTRALELPEGTVCRIKS